eukprot:gnl/MRDRNA2_/MRDRNA2_84274_c0_seq1.p1 gnl/MRDRNA2_/MRDRNA2_84274_c0~~gnl/MRDRNA2_/MRDRNA2_84274_c0_seq1.p1  ORF type:complete len:681 (-),score=118.19 gnl/MRDRNA2_/MRDRNA2_84274_c0_seq1:503-2314(-)
MTQAKYAILLQNGLSHEKARFFFLTWLSNLESFPIPLQVHSFDVSFSNLLREKLLVTLGKARANMVECLDFFHRAVEASAIKNRCRTVTPVAVTERRMQIRAWRTHAVDSAPPGLRCGTLWKLKAEGQVSNEEHWHKRDMWVAQNGNFCYFSPKEQKRLVYMDRQKFASAKVIALTEIDQSARPFAFKVSIAGGSGLKRNQFETVFFAAEDQASQKLWIDILIHVGKMEAEQGSQPIVASPDWLQELSDFKLNCKNRREVITEGRSSPCFTATLWKLKGDGDMTIPDHWFKRSMWISKDGALCYWSPKQSQNLIYYDPCDLEKCILRRLPPGKCALPHAFEVVRKAVDGCEFEPGVFAAENEEFREQWIRELKCMPQVQLCMVLDGSVSLPEDEPNHVSDFSSSLRKTASSPPDVIPDIPSSHSNVSQINSRLPKDRSRGKGPSLRLCQSQQAVNDMSLGEPIPAKSHSAIAISKPDPTPVKSNSAPTAQSMGAGPAESSAEGFSDASAGRGSPGSQLEIPAMEKGAFEREKKTCRRSKVVKSFTVGSTAKGAGTSKTLKPTRAKPQRQSTIPAKKKKDSTYSKDEEDNGGSKTKPQIDMDKE